MDAGMPELAYVDAGTDAQRWFRRMADVTVCTSCSSRVTVERSRAADMVMDMGVVIVADAVEVEGPKVG
jgi:hypothetical protein